MSASTLPNGDAAIQTGQETSYYFKQADGSFRDEAGDHVVLTYAAGAYTMIFTDGTTYQFNPNGTLAYVEDTHGNRITAGYNVAGQLATLTDSNGESLSLAYNSFGHVSTLTDSAGRTETYGYDSTGQFLTAYTDELGTTAYSYVADDLAAENALSAIAYADGTHQYFTYDSQGRLASEYNDGGAQKATIAYSASGGYTVTDANENSDTTLYGLCGDTAETIDALGNVTRYTYGADQDLIAVQDALGQSATFAYDTQGDLTSETDPLGNTTTFTYDGQHDLTSYTDPKGNTTSYAYNGQRDLLSVTYANGAEQQYTYNPLGEATGFLDADGNPLATAYNADGQVTKEIFADGTSYTYVYNTLGNLTTATDASGNVTTFVYGDSTRPDLLTEVDYPGGKFLKFQYNAVGQRTQSVDQTGYTVNYTYDAVGRLWKLTDGGGNPIVQYAYDPAGNLSQKTNGNGTYTAYTYDADGNVLTITNHASAGGAVNSFDTYTYDAVGNVATDTNQDGQWVYAYDADGQLTHAVFTPNATDPDGLTSQDLQYVYDANGNRISQTVNGVTTTYVVNSMNEYTTAAAAGTVTSCQYDPEGNLLAETGPAGTTRYSFNQLRELTGVSGPGLSAAYSYDPFGNLASQTVSGTTTSFQVDPDGNVAAAFDLSGNLLAHYAYGFGLVSQTTAAGAFYYDFNSLGSTVGITNSSGQCVNRYAYLPFGQATTVAAAVSNPFTFVGALGVTSNGGPVLAMGARWYDPATAQFLSQDPLGLAGGDANLRRYAGNNPTRYADPAGLSPDAVPVLMWYKQRIAMCEQMIEAAKQKKESEQCTIGAKMQMFGVNEGKATVLAELDSLAFAWNELVPVWIPVQKLARLIDRLNAEIDRLTQLYNRVLAEQDYRPGPPPSTLNKPGTTKTSTDVEGGDPNAIFGPSGYGTQGFLQPSGQWSYTVAFENDGSAAAQNITVTEQLDPNLDWSTFQLGSFGFGPVTVSIPAGLTQYQTSVGYQNSDGSPLDVAVALEFSVATGQLTVTFTSLDPATGETPTGVFDGFLYPDNAMRVGEGFVQYTVEPKAALASGTAISQQASLVFDINGAIVTNPPASNTIDATPPTSSVTALPATSATNFAVSWSGQDNTGGSGVASYNVYVSDNGGPFTLWQSATTQTSAVYNGTMGHTYGFYSGATDNVGNQEVKTAAAETTTQVTVQTPPGNLGIFNAGYWYRDMTGAGQWTSAITPLAFGPAGATPVTGDWDGAPSGSGKTELGWYQNGTWNLMLSNGTVETFNFGFVSSPGNTVIPVVGDWSGAPSGSGKTEVGVYCNGAWFLDYDGSHTWDATNQSHLAYLGWNDGGTNTVVPVPGDWAGDGKTEMGVYCQGVWFLDSTGAGKWDGGYSYWGWSGSLVPVVGNWGQVGGKSQFGVYTQGVWFRDMDGTHAWDAANQAAVAYFGWAGAQPVVGDWFNYTSAAGGASEPAAAAAVNLWSQAGAVPSIAGTTLQHAFLATGQPGNEVGQQEGSELAAMEFGQGLPQFGRGLPTGVASSAVQLSAINPLAVDRIDLGGLVEKELGQLAGLRI